MAQSNNIGKAKLYFFGPYYSYKILSQPPIRILYIPKSWNQFSWPVSWGHWCNYLVSTIGIYRISNFYCHNRVPSGIWTAEAEIVLLSDHCSTSKPPRPNTTSNFCCINAAWNLKIRTEKELFFKKLFLFKPTVLYF